MIIATVTGLLTDNIKVLKGEVSKAAYQGVAIAIAAILIATAMACYFETGSISVSGMWLVQKTNPALWVLNFVPFVFGFLGQHSSMAIAYQAGAMVIDQTQELRSQADSYVKQNVYVSTHDQLTNLPNRGLFYDRIEKAIFTESQQESHPRRISVLLIEIENYKEVFNALGRNSSDLILKQLASRLQEICPDKESLARIEQDTFGVFLKEKPNASLPDQMVKDILVALEMPFIIDGVYIGINPNIGIAHFPEHGTSVDNLIQKASIALHVAQNSISGYAFYRPSQHDASPAQLHLLSELRNAIIQGELELYYLPQISLKTGKTSCVEALLRWNHPERGIICPNDFIPMSEKSRMINLSQWVIRRGFIDCAAWHKQGLDINISINLSSKDILNPELPVLISSIAASAGIKPEWVIFEIKASSIKAESEIALDNLQKINGLGFKFLIDQFGAGIFSLSYLKKLPLSEIKIDRSLVSSILNSDNDSAIVMAIVSLAHSLRLTTTAYGVESQEVMDKLSEYSCDNVQGFFLCKPLSANNFLQWLNNPETQKH